MKLWLLLGYILWLKVVGIVPMCEGNFRSDAHTKLTMRISSDVREENRCRGAGFSLAELRYERGWDVKEVC